VALAAPDGDRRDRRVVSELELHPPGRARFSFRPLPVGVLHLRAPADYNKAIELNPKLADADNNRGVIA